MSDTSAETDIGKYALIEPDWPAPSRVKALITTRQGGVSEAPYDSNNLGLHVDDAEEAVLTNRQLLAQACNKNLDFQWLSQIHGNEVLTLENEAVDESRQADAIYTQQKNIACGVLTADCLSVFFCDESGSEIAVAHAGWRGLAGGVLQKTIDKFQSDVSNLLVYLGPVIGPCHFEVGDEVKQTFLDLDIQEISNQEAILFYESENTGKWMADLYAIAKIILTSRGISKIYGEPICTYCEFDQFYSFRRDGVTGRFASIIWKES